ncbi:late competence development ComFB family protein [Nostoc sp. LEGE 06077]|uniref:late competence development ComFB family protein n=1 Tax=Nostoc sp. LEGE 06077 TaxID=915325 RepID=UPI0018811D95|nr:late competence development ComFB family protein [Nostoc sp. LEGE 06077]MBE9206623.1 late competence development ComFB family protein [Nostoc sp. LEGE 06077]
MTKTLLNLTISLVVQELESILETYPHHPYQEAFANPDIKQTLIAYILSRIPNQYITVDEAEKAEFTCSESLRRSLESTLQIESIIRQGIEKVLCEQVEDVHRYIPETVDPTLVASHWFG